MGAAPIAYETIIDLSTIPCEEVDMGDSTAWHFIPTEDKTYPLLSTEDQSILDVIIQRFGRATKAEIVGTMHKKDAWHETAPKDIIQFKYAASLSLE